MTKRELIDVITSVNRTTTREFLSDFSTRDLTDYTRRLASLGLLPPEHRAAVSWGDAASGVGERDGA